MTVDEYHNEIRKQFNTLIADGESLSTQYDNVNFDKPENDKWCRLTIKDGDSFQASFGSPGSNRERTVGIMMVQLFGPSGKGDGDLLELATTIKAAFKFKNFSGVKFKLPSIKPVGLSGDEWQVNVNCPFDVDHIG